MHGCGYGMSDIYRCTPIHMGRHRDPLQSKTVTQAHPSMPFIPKYSIVSDTHTHKIKGKKIKLNRFTKRTMSEQHRQYQSAAMFNKEECIWTIRCFFSYDFSLGEFSLQSKRKMVKILNVKNRVCVSGGCPIKVCLMVHFSPWGSGQPMDRELQWLSEWGFPTGICLCSPLGTCNVRGNVGANTCHQSNSVNFGLWLARDIWDIPMHKTTWIKGSIVLYYVWQVGNTEKHWSQGVGGELTCQQHTPCVSDT